MKLTDETAKELIEMITKSVSEYLEADFGNHREHNYSEEKVEEFASYNMEAMFRGIDEDLNELLGSDVDEENYNEFQIIHPGLNTRISNLEDFLNQIDEKGVRFCKESVKGLRETLMVEKIFSEDSIPEKIDLVVATTEALTGKEEATIDEILSSIESRGYRLFDKFKTTIVLQFLLQYEGSLRGDEIRIATKPIVTADGKKFFCNVDYNGSRSMIFDENHGEKWFSKDWWIFYSVPEDSDESPEGI